MKPINIVVLSDLHVGKGARAKDFCPYPVKQIIDKDYKKRFIEFIKKEKIRADYFMIPGDVSHTAQPDEFKLASELIVELALPFNLTTERVLFVPGNHDVDWSIISKYPDDKSGFRRNQKYDPIKNSDLIFEQIMKLGHQDMLNHPYFSSWEFDDLFLVGYNSSWDDDPNKAIHHGLIQQDSLIDLDDYLRSKNIFNSKLKVFVVHHHPIQYSDPIPDEPDFSAMTNAGNLLDILKKRHFDLLIHGHKHKPSFQTYIVDSGFPIAILCSGSFSARLDTRWSGYVNNQFHLIQISGRDPKDKCVFGKVKSWTYLSGRGWIPSEKHNGILHEIPFGTYVLPNKIVRQLRPVISQLFNRKDYIEWRKIVIELPKLKNLPPDIIIEVLDTLSGELNFHRHGQVPDEIVLLNEV